MRFLRVGALLLVIAAAGCSAPRSRVSGVVRYKGKPLEGATIVFVAPDNRTYPARIHADGSYDMPAVARGHILVAIQPAPPRPRPRADPTSRPAAKGRDAFAKGKMQSEDNSKGGPPPPSAEVPTGITIPAKYADAHTSGLEFDLTDAEQQYSVDLTD